MLRNKLLTSKGYIATLFNVFSNRNQVLCTGIWEQREGRKSFIVIGEDLKQMYSQYQSNPKCLPRQISHFVDRMGAVKYAVLWSDFHSNRYPDVEPLWSKREIPVRFLQGSPDLLSESQMDFLIERVEHFMRELNIPGLSIAISKREQLKFAAGGFSNK
uniref:DUF2750 domain-containing protein n=1 Tax=Haemonchus contortus TaxID=6289 RepID=A0A7I4Z4Z1_HAECO